MKSFDALPAPCRSFLLFWMFTLLVAELYLLVRKTIQRAPQERYPLSILMIGAHLFLLQVFSPGYGGSLTLPWAWGAGDILVSALHLYVAFPREKRRAAATLSARSIIEATDDLPMGVCFSDAKGRVTLCNNTMGGLLNQLTGGYPQVLEEITAAIGNPPEAMKSEAKGCLRFPGGSVYRFTGTALTVDGEAGWYQLTAQNVTEQVEINRQLARQNEKLKKTNGKLQKMYDRIADDIREKESLEFKIYIHDTMGRSLLTIQDIMNSAEETAQKLRSLEEAVAVLSSHPPAAGEGLYDAVRSSEALGVRLQITGALPQGSPAETLCVRAARECVTNCIRHAKGTEVQMDIRHRGECCTVTFTNNGAKPTGPIIEGSGLSSLRNSVEAFGGEMELSWEGAFALILKLPGKERDDEDPYCAGRG